MYAFGLTSYFTILSQTQCLLVEEWVHGVKVLSPLVDRADFTFLLHEHAGDVFVYVIFITLYGCLWLLQWTPFGHSALGCPGTVAAIKCISECIQTTHWRPVLRRPRVTRSSCASGGFGFVHLPPWSSTNTLCFSELET